jgi:biopolymer transport protein ExbD
MNSGGMIVRLIDICMILLFGFICSSELTEQSNIILPKTLELPPVNPDPEMVVFVWIQSDGSFQFLTGGGLSKTYDTNVLERYLQIRKDELARTQYNMRVRIRANYDTPFRLVMQAANVCDRIDVLKTVDVRIGTLTGT